MNYLNKNGKKKRFLALARVSSRTQEQEGTSLEVQEEALQKYATKECGVIVRFWRITETASKAEQRKSFKEILAYARANAAALDGLLVFKLDRATRNMSDYGKLLEIESIHRVPLIAISQPTQNTPAGRMARNMMAATATYFAEQLSEDVRRGLAQRVREGWFPTVAPYGYYTERIDGRSVVKIEQREAENVRRIYDLYANHHCTIDMVHERIASEGRVYTPKQPHWGRSKIHRVLRDRSYIGDLKWHGQWRPGKHPPIVERLTFERVQSLLGGRVYKSLELTYAGKLIVCGHCGHPVTGEIITKRSGKSYTYYRCSRYTTADHPRDRIPGRKIDDQIAELFGSLRQPEPIQRIFREALSAWATRNRSQARSRTKEIQEQLDAIRRQQDRLLNIHLAGTIDEPTFAKKDMELRDRIASLTSELERSGRRSEGNENIAIKTFELSQALTEKWLVSNHVEKRRLLNFVCLNLVLKGASLCIATRKPFCNRTSWMRRD